MNNIFICEICKHECCNIKSLAVHVARAHKISKETFDALSESLLKIKKLTDIALLTANTLIDKNNNKSNNN